MKIIIHADGSIICQSDDPSDVQRYEDLLAKFRIKPGVKSAEGGEVENHKLMSPEEHQHLHEHNTQHQHEG